MREFYVVAASGVLLFGRGNVVEGYYDGPQLAFELQAAARDFYPENAPFSFADFAYPFVSLYAPLLVGGYEPKRIESVGQAVGLLEAKPFGKFAMGFYNAIIAGDFGVMPTLEVVVLQIFDEFVAGGFLVYPRDEIVLQNEVVLQRLPGLVRFLLRQEAVAVKAFVNYLRKGVVPDVSQNALWSRVNHKKSVNNCAFELDFELGFLTKDNFACEFKKRKVPADEVLEVLELIYAAMLGAQQAARDAAAEHTISFRGQIMDKFGIIPNIDDEPYLEAEVKRFELQLLKTLERLFGRMEKLLGGGKCDGLEFEVKRIDPNLPLPDQIRDRVAYETNHMKGRMKRALDNYRQQQMGVTHYIWRSQDDERVRGEHQAYDDQIFAWAKPPADGHPGEAFGCRCWAEPAAEGAGEPRVQVAMVGSLVKLIGSAAKIIAKNGKKVKKVAEKVGKKIPKLNDTKTWPKPPTKEKLKEGLPSRNKPRSRGEKSLYDEKGGEWRYNPGDKYHNPHWDYKPSGKNIKWKNVPIDDLPPIK